MKSDDGMIVVDGREMEWHPGMTLEEVLNKIEIKFPMYTVKVNGILVPKDKYREWTIEDGSEINIIYIIAGG